MKSWSKFLVGILAMYMVVGCSENDNLVDAGQVNTGDPKDVTYMSINVALPTARGTRSQTNPDGTSTDGTEVGLDKENNVKKILLILANADDTFGAYGVVENLSIPAGQTTIKTAVKMDRTDIGQFYDQNGNIKNSAKNGIHVYVFCNPTDELINEIDALGYGDNWSDKTCNVLQSHTAVTNKNVSIWADNSFLMSNASMALREIPSTFEVWRVNHDTENNAFELSGGNNGGINNASSNGRGAVKVERSMARFDFKDGSPADTPANTYNIGLEDQAGLLQVQLLRMGMVNMSKNFYYLRRVSDDGKGLNKLLCGAETDDNYIDDTDANFKTAGTLDASKLADYFNYPFFDNNGKINDNTRLQWDNYWIADVLGYQEDNPAYAKGGYHIWRYVTENTIPKDNNKQRNGISTGVVFKGKLLSTPGLESKNEPLYKAINGVYQLPTGVQGYTYTIGSSVYPILYTFQNVIYVGWNAGVAIEAIKEINGQKVNAELYKAYSTPVKDGKNPHQFYQELVQAKGTDGERAALDNFREAATAAGFTLYQASNDAEGLVSGSANAGVGYYFYYYYWNRHNDNKLPGTMGQMEFGVVRNNVYKLAVTGIAKLGHPRITDNDPDPVDPNTPDESGDVFITVAVEALPWVVRENNIEF